MSEETSPSDALVLPRTAVSEAVLTEAVHHVDIVHTSLVGMTAIVLVLLAALALPVFGLAPVTQPVAFAVMVVAAFVGIAGLYYLNYRVHQHVTNQARLTEVLVNSLGQGFLVFGKDGVCGTVYSQACLDLLETVPSAKKITDVLRVPEEQRSDFQDWFDILFQPDHALGFEDVIRFFPSFFPHSQNRRVSLVYRPIYRRDGALVSVVVIATDQTEEYAAREAVKRQEAYADMICRIFRERNKFHATMDHLRQFLEETGKRPQTLQDASTILRQLHTLKATVKQFNLVDLADVIHSVENDLRSPLARDEDSFAKQALTGRQRIADIFLRVSDEVRGLVGGEREWRGNVREIEEKDLFSFALEMKRQGADPVLIQHYLDRVAAVPIRECLLSFERELQELAAMLDKQVRPIRYAGDNPRVLTLPMQDFLYSLTHICRNIMDHGIEAPVTRMARSKDPAGQVTIDTSIVPCENGSQEWLRIVISDDGNGIDPSRVRAKLGMLDPEGSWRFEDDQTIIQRIFSWGFSTREEVTSISGRGVGLEVVEREVNRLGGSIHVTSELYKGASFEIRIPYCLDISLVERANEGFDGAIDSSADADNCLTC